MAYELFVPATTHGRSGGECGKMAIVSFAGSAEGIGRIPLFEFQRFLETECPEFDKFFYHDVKRRWYHKGIHGLSTGVKDTAAYLQGRLSTYEKVAFLGASAGGYAALLYGCLVKEVTTVIAFNPQTLVHGADLDQEYVDLKPVLEDAARSSDYKRFFLIGDVRVTHRDRYHHIWQCERVEHIKDHVFVIKEYPSSNLKVLRDSGQLRELVLRCLSGIIDTPTVRTEDSVPQ